MAIVYDDHDLPTRSALLKAFKKIDVVLISTEWNPPVFPAFPTIYYGQTIESSVNTIEEFAPIPINLYLMLRALTKQSKNIKDLE